MAKKSTISGATRLKLIILVIVLFAVGVCAFLHFTGIYSFDRLLQDMGYEDKPAEQPQTQVSFIDVGQGDCTIVMSEGKTMLVDCGEYDPQNKVVEELRQLGVTKLDYIVVTHPHSDHMGKMADVLKSFDTDKFIMPKVPDNLVPTSVSYEKMLKQIKQKGMKITRAEDTEFSLGRCTVRIFAPQKKYENLNNYSVLVKITDGENSFLVTGDCEQEEEKEFISRNCDLSSKVLKVAHHGSYTSSSAQFLDRVAPRYAVISCGKDNKYGHPHEKTVTRLKKYVNDLYITMNDGTVTFLSDGKGLTVKTEKGEKE